MKKISLFALSLFLLFSFTTSAQKYSKEDIDFLKQLRKSMYDKFYTNDSLISKTVDPEANFLWESQTFKHTAAILDTLGLDMQAATSSNCLFLFTTRFPKDITEQDCNFFSSKLISYNLLNEKGEKIKLRKQQTYYSIIKRYQHSVLTGYQYTLGFIPLVPTSRYNGTLEYDISAPVGFDVITITKADTGKNVTINKNSYTVLSFTKNYVALKCDTSLKEIDFEFVGTDNTDKKYQYTFMQKKGCQTAFGRGSFFISEEMYNYYISHPNLSERELNKYVNDYFKRHANSLVTGEAQILIIQDIGYVEKMFFYWPNAFATKQFQKIIDIK